MILCLHQIDHDLGLDPDSACYVSAKTGEGVDSLFEAIVNMIPSPQGKNEDPLKALIFDSHYDSYRGVIVHCRVFDGSLRTGDEIRFMHSDAVYKVEECGIFQLQLCPTGVLNAGDVGYFIAGIKTISDIRVGDTVTSVRNPASEPLAGFKEVKPVVFSSIYPVDSNDYEELQEAIERLKLNDASLVYEKDSSAALGFGFRCGFLGMLHLEVVQERIEREFDLSIVFTSPSVRYIVHMKNGETLYIDNPLEYPEVMRIESVEEPYIRANIITPVSFVGPVISLCLEKRGYQTSMNYLDEKRVELVYEMPLAEVLFDFYDRLKSISRGYASFDYEVIEYKATDLVRLDILVIATHSFNLGVHGIGLILCGLRRVVRRYFSGLSPAKGTDGCQRSRKQNLFHFIYPKKSLRGSATVGIIRLNARFVGRRRNHDGRSRLVFTNTANLSGVKNLVIVAERDLHPFNEVFRPTAKTLAGYIAKRCTTHGTGHHSIGRIAHDGAHRSTRQSAKNGTHRSRVTAIATIINGHPRRHHSDDLNRLHFLSLIDLTGPIDVGAIRRAVVGATRKQKSGGQSTACCNFLVHLFSHVLVASKV